jgi:hypothetical protein
VPGSGRIVGHSGSDLVRVNFRIARQPSMIRQSTILVDLTPNQGLHHAISRSCATGRGSIIFVRV